jgi:nucleoside-diphosphate-sugar epimerase
VASGQPLALRDLVLEIADVLGARDRVALGALPYREGDPPFICASTAKLRASTDFRPTYDLRAGLAQTIAWWKGRP